MTNSPVSSQESSVAHDAPQSTPWYKPSYVWLVVALPLSAVVAGIITVIIAFKNSDSVVKDEYRKDGFAIQQDTQLIDNGKNLGIAAEVIQDTLTGELFVTLKNAPESPTQSNLLNIDLVHPTQADLDITLQLKPLAAPGSEQKYRVDLEQPLQGKRMVWITAPGQWQIKQEANF